MSGLSNTVLLVVWIVLAIALIWMVKKWRIYEKVSNREAGNTSKRDKGAAVKSATKKVKAGADKIDPKARPSAELLKRAAGKAKSDKLILCLKTWLKQTDDDKLVK